MMTNTSAGLAWSSFAHDLHDSGRHESASCKGPFPGPWRARRLDSVDEPLLHLWDLYRQCGSLHGPDIF